MGTLICLGLLLALLPIYLLLHKARRSPKRLPPGSLGLPIIGQSLEFLRALSLNKGEEWLEARVNKYGPVSKLSLFGGPTVFITGPAANKFVFHSDAVAAQQPKSISRILGRRNILELAGEEHKRIRGAIMQFLRLDVLKGFVGKIDMEVKSHLRENWMGRQEVTVMPLMKRLTFDITCTLIFGLEQGDIRPKILEIFKDLVEGLWSVPVNLPFTTFNKSLRASKRIRMLVAEIIKDKRAILDQNHGSSYSDLVTYLLSLRDKDAICTLTEEEIIDNIIVIMIASYETTSSLLTFLIRHLAKDPISYAKIVEEQEEIDRTKASEEALTWDDVSNMKYTWRVAMEMLRMIPPVFGLFRKVVKDVEFDGYQIPKGWQVFMAMNFTHMDGQNFAEPSNFDPSHFEKQSSIPPYSFVPFGGGMRICPGNELVRLETLILVHYLVKQFRWKICSEDDSFGRRPVLEPFKGLPIKLEAKS